MHEHRVAAALQHRALCGNLTIETDRLRVTNGGIITNFTQGESNAGRLQIRAKESVMVTKNQGALTK